MYDDKASAMEMIFKEDLKHSKGTLTDTYTVKIDRSTIEIEISNIFPHSIKKISVMVENRNSQEIVDSLLRKSSDYNGKFCIYHLILNFAKIVNNESEDDPGLKNFQDFEKKKVTEERFYQWLSSKKQTLQSQEDRGKTGKSFFLKESDIIIGTTI